MEIRSSRQDLGISQSRLARLAGVSRFKVCTFELGSGSLSKDEHRRLEQALLNEAERLRALSTKVELSLGEEAAQANTGAELGEGDGRGR